MPGSSLLILIKSFQLLLEPCLQLLICCCLVPVLWHLEPRTGCRLCYIVSLPGLAVDSDVVRGQQVLQRSRAAVSCCMKCVMSIKHWLYVSSADWAEGVCACTL